MTIYYLYVKTHLKTGLKYFGQTTRNPIKYSGSGIDWKNHLKRYGSEVHTEIIFQTTSKQERNYWGRYYSLLWNIVGAVDDFGNKIWANRIPETGSGAGSPRTPELINSFRNRVIKHHEQLKSEGIHPTSQNWTCIHCNKQGTNLLNYANSHGDNCKFNPNIDIDIIIKRRNTSKLLSSVQKKSQKESVAKGIHNTQVHWHCIHCNLNGRGKGNYRFHGDNCLLNPNLSDDEKEFRKKKSNSNPMKKEEIAIKLSDPTVYVFQNIISGEIKHLTRHEFIKQYGGKRSNLTNLVKGKVKSVRGWRILN